MSIIRKLAVCAAPTVALLLGTASQSYADATPIANGHLKGGPTISAPAPSIIDLTFSLVELPNGSLVGSGKLTKKADKGWMKFDVTSYMFVGDGVLMVAGTVTQVHTGPNTVPFWELGDTVFFAVKDNGNGGPNGAMDEFIEGRIPAAFGPISIQQIHAMIGEPPAEIYREGLSGNIHFH